MKRCCFLWLMLLSFHQSLFAGHIYGRLWFSGKSLPPKQRVAIQCGPDKPQSSETDNNGAYRLFIKATGRCRLTVNYNGKEFSTDVFSYPQPTAYDFDLATDGAKNLRRR